MGFEGEAKGVLYLCATPIGNLGDITDRVKQTLSGVDLIAAEDTRNSRKLLNYFEIHTELTSYHEHNKYEKAEELVQQLIQGKNIALITDAGTPGISDPGEVLVQQCVSHGIPVTSLPGPSAVITALTLAGLSARRFVFEGFLPTQKKERQEILQALKKEERTIVLYEAPHRLKATLELLLQTLGDRKASLCRELTKLHEEVLRENLSGLLAWYEQTEPRGEYVLVIEGRNKQDRLEEERTFFQNLSIREHVLLYMEKGMDKKEAMKQVSADRGIPKREIYKELLKEDENEKDR